MLDGWFWKLLMLRLSIGESPPSLFSSSVVPSSLSSCALFHHPSCGECNVKPSLWGLRRESFLTACMIESSFYCCFLAFNEHSDTSVVDVLSVTMWSVCWVEGVGRGWDQRPRVFSINGPIFGIGVICKRIPYEITSQQWRGIQEIIFERGLSKTRAQISADQIVKLPSKHSLPDSWGTREKLPGLYYTQGQMEGVGGLLVLSDGFRTFVPGWSAPLLGEVDGACV